MLKIGIIISTLSVVVYKVTNNKDVEDIIEYYETVVADSENISFIFMIIALMFLNWSIEAIKWNLLVNRIEQISFLRALSAIFAGITLGVFTPNRIGEYAGRVLWVKHKNRIIVALITLITSAAQIITTIIIGSISFYFYYIHFIRTADYQWFEIYLIVLIGLISTLLIVLFINTPALFSLTRKLNLSKKMRKYLSVFNRYNSLELIKVFGLSIVRYAVFSFQLILLLVFFKVSIQPTILFIMIPMIFLVMAIIPSIALAELGIREALALSFLGQVSDNHLGIVSATFFLWLINLAIPAGIGSLLILQTKIFKKEMA